MVARIYFAASLRGGADFAMLQRRIGFLESLGTVLTRHMASPHTADMGSRSDKEIYAEDQRLLSEADLFIGDFSSPSTGSGFMAAHAVQRKIPTLALFRDGQRASAMITGCPEIATRFFSDEPSFDAALRAFLLENEARFSNVRFRAPKIFLAGPPGSGKGTLGAALSRKTGAPHLSTGELLRELVAKDPSAKVGEYMRAGQLVPAELMRDLVLERLRQPDCRLFGFILDGYPPSRADLANLISGGISPDLVCYLDCGDGTAVQRQVKRAARSTDNEDKAKERMSVFHRAEVSFESLASTWYPDSVVMRIDAEQSAAAVEAMVLKTVENLFGDPRRASSFFLVEPYKSSRSTRVHFHVDSKDASIVHAIARRIHARHKGAQGQVKQYPIRSLHLGPQVAKLPVYPQLPNFHPITDSNDESFLTGRLGDGDDALMKVVLEETRAAGGMAELEEYLGEWTLQPDGSVTEDARYSPLPFSDAAFSDFAKARCTDIPKLELHLGFDLPKTSETLPIPLGDLMNGCARRGLDNGGWFLFKKEGHWAYRSNEFSSADPQKEEARLFEQARQLKALLAEAGLRCPVSFSLERVHGIWTF